MLFMFLISAQIEKECGGDGLPFLFFTHISACPFKFTCLWSSIGKSEWLYLTVCPSTSFFHYFSNSITIYNSLPSSPDVIEMGALKKFMYIGPVILLYTSYTLDSILTQPAVFRVFTRCGQPGYAYLKRSLCNQKTKNCWVCTLLCQNR